MGSIFESKLPLHADDNVTKRGFRCAVNIKSLTFDESDTGETAMQKLPKAKPCDYDAILMDIQVLIMNGYETTNIISQTLQTIQNHHSSKSVVCSFNQSDYINKYRFHL